MENGIVLVDETFSVRLLQCCVELLEDDHVRMAEPKLADRLAHVLYEFVSLGDSLGSELLGYISTCDGSRHQLTLVAFQNFRCGKMAHYISNTQPFCVDYCLDGMIFMSHVAQRRAVLSRHN